MNLIVFALWVLVGLPAGWLAGVVMKHGGYGLRKDIVLGLVGSLMGGGLAWALGTTPEAWAVLGVAFVGAAILIVLQRKIWPATA